MGRLFWKFFLAFWLALLVAGAGVGMVVWLHQQASEEAAQELSGGPRAAFLVNATAALLRHGGMAALRDLLADWQQRGGAHVYIVDDQGQEVLGRAVSADILAQARQQAETAQESRMARLETVDGRPYLFFVPSDTGKKLFHHRSPPTSPLLPLTVGILASLAFSVLLAWYLAKPIRYLRSAFEGVATGQLDTRIGPRMGRRRDEVADLGRDFDRMAEQLQQLVGSQRRLLHDVSHELRSPLARLQAAIGLARQQPGKLDASLERIERESGRLDQLVGELLTLSRLQAGISGPADEEIDLVELVREIAADAHFEAETIGRQVLFSGEGEAVVTVRAEPLYRAFENVIRNALKYTPEGTAVEVRLQRRTAPERLIVTVLDRGPGIPESDLQAIFEPFFRGGDSTSTAGFGLGLAIARRAIEAHGGSIQAKNRQEGGLRVEMVLPIRPGVTSREGRGYL